MFDDTASRSPVAPVGAEPDQPDEGVEGADSPGPGQDFRSSYHLLDLLRSLGRHIQIGRAHV